jgi:succinate dehydrogenase/fumarate reductase flavoprotein subunit
MATVPLRLAAVAAAFGAVAYTFGGLATDDRARVLRAGSPIRGLYAAGEITGHFYATAPNSVSVLRAFVFGRIAGREAVSHCMTLREANQTTRPPPRQS